MLTAADIMSRPVVSVHSTTPLEEAGALLADYGYAGLPVTDSDGVLLGMLTSGDVLRADRTRQQTAGAVMTAPAVVAEMFSGVDGVGRLLLQRGIRSVPVVDDHGRVIGILSRGDLLRLNVTSDDAVAVGVQKLLDDYTGKRRWVAQVRDGLVTVAGVFDDDSERRIAMQLARMVPGANEVRLGSQLD
ncbi:HPP family protein [Mycolicibacterium sp. F2034L]|uniref:CBS domain-containing protein n=1 Tax=Mycolicibacterium sp. F2034L TaxID=2926422 RepID=UPI001FF1ECA9|nr:CBS domain-containing protein [Mycolicibacterium sp. F2034L]MCK0176175.1 CBS domain-containing protein [Mycolicibacterium sp. F2034L]